MKQLMQSIVVILIMLNIVDSLQSKEISHYRSKTRNVYYKTNDVISQGERFSFTERVVIEKIHFTYWTPLSEGKFYIRVFGNEGGNNVPLEETDLVEPIEIEIKNQGLNKVEVELESSLKIDSPQIFVVLENNELPVYLVSDSEERHPNCSSDYDGKYYNQVIKSDYKGWTVGSLAFDISLSFESYESNEKPVFSPIDIGYVFNQDNSFSLSFADLNNDSFLDMIYNGRIYLNQANFEFKCIDSTISDIGISQANIIIDVNNDGLEDILFLGVKDSNSNKSYLYLQEYGFQFKLSEMDIPEFVYVADFKVCDLNDDNYLDFVVTQNCVECEDLVHVPHNYIFINNKNNQFAESILSTGKDESKLSYACKIIDYNEDGKDDIHIVNFNKNDEVWVRNNNETEQSEYFDYVEINKHDLRKDYIDYCTVDLDNDGQIEKLYPIVGLTNQHLQLPFISENGEISHISDHHKSINYSSIATGDLDNDGKTELFFSTPCDCNFSRIYSESENINNRQTFESENIYKRIGENSAFIDLNNDGQLDLIGFEDSNLVIYKNNTDINNYLELVANSDEYNNQSKYIYSLYTTGNVFYSSPSNQEGLLIQRPNILHFGLQENTIIDSLVIADNEGNIERVIYDLDVNKKYNIEDFATYNEQNKGRNPINVAPNPFVDKVEISFIMPIWTEVNLRITDINGKLIWKRRVLCQNEGLNKVVWNAYDKTYQKIPNGTYFINLEHNSQVKVIKVIKIDN